MSNEFRPLVIPLALTLLLSACAGNAPRRPGDSRSDTRSLAEQNSDFLAECQRREELNQPRSPSCPTTSESRFSQPTLGPLASPFPSLPGLPGSLTR